jgi:hypothetical protein
MLECLTPADCLIIKCVDLVLFHAKNQNMKFYSLQLCDSNFHGCFGMLACMSHWIWYFRTLMLAVVISMADFVLCL